MSVSHLKELNDIVDSLSPTEEQETERAKVEREKAVKAENVERVVEPTGEEKDLAIKVSVGTATK